MTDAPPPTGSLANRMAAACDKTVETLRAEFAENHGALPADDGEQRRVEAVCALLENRTRFIAGTDADPASALNLAREAFEAEVQHLAADKANDAELKKRLALTQKAFENWLKELGIEQPAGAMGSVEELIAAARQDKARLNPLPTANPGLTPDRFPKTPAALAQDVIDALEHCREKIQLVIEARYKNLPANIAWHSAEDISMNLTNIVVSCMKQGAKDAGELISRMVASLSGRMQPGPDVDEQSREKLFKYRTEMLLAFEIFAQELGVASQMREAVKTVPKIDRSQGSRTP